MGVQFVNSSILNDRKQINAFVDPSISVVVLRMTCAHNFVIENENLNSIELFFGKNTWTPPNAPHYYAATLLHRYITTVLSLPS